MILPKDANPRKYTSTVPSGHLPKWSVTLTLDEWKFFIDQ